jgi:L-asparaginase
VKKNVVVLGMGGTIAGRSSSTGDNVGYKAGAVEVADLLAAISSLPEVMGAVSLVVDQVAKIDSKDLDDAHWLALAQRVEHYLSQPDVISVVITHGTDTLEETAYFLSCVLSQQALIAKPVVLTCAMRPVTALAPDGPQNVLDAMAVALHPGALGVLVVCAGAIHSADHVQKTHPYRVDAFDSGEAGPLGYVEEGLVRLVNAWPSTVLSSDDASNQYVFNSLPLPEVPWPRVEIVFSHAGACGAMVDAICRSQLTARPLRGIVVAGTGNGTIHQDLEAALQRALAQGISVVRSTRCAYGAVVSTNAPRANAIAASHLSPVKARVQMVLDLMCGVKFKKPMP